MSWSSRLRTDLHTHAERWREGQDELGYTSLGASPTTLFVAAPDGGVHGNFEAASWAAIQAHPTWAQRLTKPHPRRDALPPEQASRAAELDSSTSSDALLMNCFCHPGAAKRIFDRLGLPGDGNDLRFGVRPGVPLADGNVDATEVDMASGSLLVEAKLTETSFTSRDEAVVRRYRDLETCFDVDALPRLSNGTVAGYQLVRNVLAAHHLSEKGGGRHFLALIDSRRPDLLQEWWSVYGAVRDVGLRRRCHVRTWQEVAAAAPPRLRQFLAVKYGM